MSPRTFSREISLYFYFQYFQNTDSVDYHEHLEHAAYNECQALVYS